MKKLCILILLFTTFFAAQAQYNVTLSFDDPSILSGSTLCLKNNVALTKKIWVNVYKNSSDQAWGSINLVFKNINGVKNVYSLGLVTPNSFTSNQVFNKSYDIQIGALFSPGNLDGQLYIQYLDDPANINLQSNVYINYKINNLSVPASASFCPGQTVASLAASGCTSYSWSPSTGLNTTTGSAVQASPIVNTTYTVTGTINGCANTKTVSVSKANDLSVVPTSATSCPTQGTTLTASGSTSYSWSPPTGLNTTTGPTVIATPTANTTYTVTGTKNGCTQNKTVPIAVVSPCGATLSNAIDLGSFYTCPLIFTSVYNNSTANNYGNDYGTNKTNGQTSDDIYFKFYYDSYSGEGTMLTVSTWEGDTNFDTYIHLLDANGNWLQSNDNVQNSTTYTYSNIVRNISESYYYIVVEGKAAASGNFSLAINAGSDCARIGNMDASNTAGTLSISPNPSHDYLNITLPSSDIEGEIAIYTMEGTLVKTITTQTQSNTISVTDLAAGFYLFKIKQGDFIKTEKIIIN